MDKGCMVTAAIMAVLCAALAGVMYFLVSSLRDGGGDSGSEVEAQAQTAPVVSPIPWSELDAIYRIIPKSDAANTPDAPLDLEGEVGLNLLKESAWSKFKGKVVEWEGEVIEVKKSSLGIRMNPSTAGKDLVLALKKTDTSKAKKLNSGDRIKFRGRLRSWSSVIQFAMDQGEILDKLETDGSNN